MKGHPAVAAILPAKASILNNLTGLREDFVFAID